VKDEDRQWKAIESVVPGFTGLLRSEAESLAAALGLRPRVLDWDMIGEEAVALASLPRTTSSPCM
jgi:hypothetical protein